MKDNKNITDIGVIVGRFQIDRLHKGHLALLDHVTNLHNKVIVFLGVAPGEHKEDQALGFATREKMVKAAYPNVIVQSLRDINDDELWSKQVDGKIKDIFHHGSVTLYGGRESFIPHYKGSFKTFEVENAIEESATARRNEIKREIRDSEDFRAGILYHAANSYPNVFPAVDIAIVREMREVDGTEGRGEFEVLLARKPAETKFRFPGGHVDPEDESYEAAAFREAREEVGNFEFRNPQYVCSMRVDDWRYRSSKNKITTTLFKFDYGFGAPKAADDVVECKWFKFNDLLRESYLRDNIVKEHRALMLELFKNMEMKFLYSGESITYHEQLT
jgi:bifunctional NMN adenylyltransferase/nudix hydrolase